MSDPNDDRRISVIVCDPQGQLLRGAVFTAQIDGEEMGRVDESFGRADWTIPAGDNGAVTVTATYEGEQKTAKLGVLIDNYTFTFTRTPVLHPTNGGKDGAAAQPEPMPNNASRNDPKAVGARPSIGPVHLFLLSLVALAVVALPVGWLINKKDPAIEAADAIARHCAGGATVRNESELKAGLADNLSKLSSGAKVDSTEVGVVTSKLTATQVSDDMYGKYTACLSEGTDDFLKLKGKLVEARAGSREVAAAALPPANAPVPADAAAPASHIQGWAYYEENAGEATGAGVIVPAGPGQAPAYRDLKVGTILRARQAFHLRTKPDRHSELIDPPPNGVIQAGRCAQILSAPEHVESTQDGTSAGDIEVRIVPCTKR